MNLSTLLCVLAVVASAMADENTITFDGAATDNATWNAFEEWLEDYDITFNGTDRMGRDEEEEKRYRYNIWLENFLEYLEHNENSDEHGFTVGPNPFMAMTDEEFYEYWLTTLPDADYPEDVLDEATNTPDDEQQSGRQARAVDWRSQGMVSSVKNQGQCGSCYAFSATGALEGAWKKAHGTLPSLSEQQLVDCSGRYGNYGCQGGWYQSGWKYIKAAGGIASEQSYPYTARQGRCKFDRRNVVATVSGFHDTQPGSESALTTALAQVGPVSIAIDASPSTFRSYRSGVHYSRSCSSRRLNHAVLAVGYGSEGGRDYYLVKNSWGTRWGAGGYIKMARNMRNNCGIASKPSFPIV